MISLWEELMTLRLMILCDDRPARLAGLIGHVPNVAINLRYDNKLANISALNKLLTNWWDSSRNLAAHRRPRQPTLCSCYSTEEQKSFFENPVYISFNLVINWVGISYLLLLQVSGFTIVWRKKCGLGRTDPDVTFWVSSVFQTAGVLPLPPWHVSHPR